MRKLALIGALGVAMFAMACSSKDNSSASGSSTGTATGTATATATTSGSGSGTGTGPGGGTGTGPGDGSGGGTGGGSGSTDPRALLNLLGTGEYQVTYNTEGTSAQGAFTGAMTMYQKQDRQRVDFSSVENEQTFEITSIITPDGTIFCIIAEETCLNSPSIGGTDPSAFALQILDDLRAGGAEVQLNPIGQRTIAGVTAECFEATQSTGSGSTCISQDGVPLSMDYQGSDGSTWKMEATDYSSTVADDEFTPPFEVTSLGF